MPTSFPTKDDERFLVEIANLKAAGATVSIHTMQDAESQVTRIVNVQWQTHNPKAQVIA